MRSLLSVERPNRYHHSFLYTSTARDNLYTFSRRAVSLKEGASAKHPFSGNALALVYKNGLEFRLAPASLRDLHDASNLLEAVLPDSSMCDCHLGLAYWRGAIATIAAICDSEARILIRHMAMRGQRRILKRWCAGNQLLVLARRALDDGNITGSGKCCQRLEFAGFGVTTLS